MQQAISGSHKCCKSNEVRGCNTESDWEVTLEWGVKGRLLEKETFKQKPE